MGSRPVGGRAAQGASGRAGLADAFRDAFAGHPGGVAVVTAAGPRGPVGLTASSVISVSVAPPTLAFSLSSARGSAGALLTADFLAVHLLSTDHEDLARLFSGPGADRFGPDTSWDRAPTGEPLLAGPRVILRCRILTRTPVAGSTIVAAQVVDLLGPGTTTEGGASPLVHYRRGYHRLQG
ncbi:MAG TPA: flavin reductase family protein [Arthrobacter sp.]|nr:flavin reductase family protein [Arthrobacter sp.]